MTVAPLKPYELTKRDDLKEKLKSKGKEIFDFTLGDPREPTPAFLVDTLHKSVPKISQYPSATGSDSFKNSCAQWIQNRFRISIDSAKEIISTNGSKEGIFHAPFLVQDHFDRKDTIIIPSPSYPVYRSGALITGAKIFDVMLRPEKNYIFDPMHIPDDIAQKTAILWLNYPHNPTGATIPKTDLEKIYLWCCKHNILLFSDECYVDNYDPQTPRPVSLLEISKDNHFKNSLCFFSLSKRSGMTGYRSGFIAGEEQLVQKYATLRAHMGSGTPQFIQDMAAAAWGDQHHVAERNHTFADKRNIIAEFFREKNISFVPSKTTIYLWAQTPKGESSGQDYADKLANHCGIFVTPGETFGKNCQGTFRIALVPTIDEIQRALQIWKNYD